MFAATTEGVDLARLLLDLLIVLGVSRLAAELAERVNIPAVLGEIAAGIIIGPSVVGLVQLDGHRGVSVAVLAEFGVLLLLVQVGMEMDLAELSKVGKASLLVAVIGVVLPFAGGAVTGVAMGEGVKTAIFLGAALTATSVGITARVFGDLHALATTEARIVVGAAVADDVLGLVILTVVVKVVTEGAVGVGTVLTTLGMAIVFLLVTGAFGLMLVPKALNLLHRYASSGATLVVAGIVLTLAFAELADQAKLAFIIGAFMAGLALGRSDHHERIATDFGSLGNIFIPVFFVQIGINADLAAMAKPSVLGLAGVLTVVGIAGKVAAAAGAAGTRADKLLVGIGMIPRGEVGLIFASIGLSTGVLDKDLYGALLVVVLVTTIVTPPLLRIRIGRTAQQTVIDDTLAGDEPPGGWLDIVDDEIHLRATPPSTQTVPIALRTASLLGTARPGDDVLDWFGANRLAELTWHPDDTVGLVKLLRSHDARTWRFLDVTGILERALPEVDAAIQRRRGDIRDLDPLGALRFPVVDALHERRNLDDAPHDDNLVLAAFAADVCSDSPDERQCAVTLASRLGRAGDADRIAELVADAQLFRSSSGDVTAFEEHEVLQLATHLANSTHARQAYTLALALPALPRRHRDALTERYHMVREALDYPELTGTAANNLAGARLQIAQRLATPAAGERLRHAPASYLLAHHPAELARQARLLEPLPRSGVVRVVVSAAEPPDTWKVDVACREAPSLLAHLTGVLSAFHLDVLQASVATWPDGAVLDSFTVRSPQVPPDRDLALAMESALRSPLTTTAMADLTLVFDNESLPWHTVCTVTGPDQTGALQALCAAFAAAGAVVHNARITSENETINDRFTISDRLGHKLDDALSERVRRALAGERVRRRFRRL